MTLPAGRIRDEFIPRSPRSSNPFRHFRFDSDQNYMLGIISSLAGFIPLSDAPSYCASKAAVLSYGLALRGAVEQNGVRVSVVCPGYVATPMIGQETGWKPFEMSAETAAERTVRGLAANRAVISFPRVLATMSWIGGLLPDRVRRYTARPFRFKVASKDAP